MASPSRSCKNAEPGTPHAKRPAPKPGPRCVTCWREHRRAQTKTSHEKRVGNLYGLLPGEYDLLLSVQEGRCAICRVARGVVKRLAVDHDHAIEAAGDLRGSVRGLLCGTCNKLLGTARDDPEFFFRAAEYLQDPPARKVLVS